MNMTVSDTVGSYAVEVHNIPGATFRIDGYLAGSPDLAGTTINTLTSGLNADIFLRDPTAPDTAGGGGGCKLVGPGGLVG